MFARACEGLLLAAGIVSLPLEDPGLVQVVQDFTADGVVEVELEAVDVVVGGDEGFGGDDVEGDVGAEAARIGMVAAVTGARRAPGGLRRAGGVGELREDGRAAGGDQALLLEGGEHGALVGGGDRRSRVLDDGEDGLPEFGIAQTAGGRADDFVRGLDDVALAGHVDRGHGGDFDNGAGLFGCGGSGCDRAEGGEAARDGENGGRSGGAEERAAGDLSHDFPFTKQHLHELCRAGPVQRRSRSGTSGLRV